MNTTDSRIILIKVTREMLLSAKLNVIDNAMEVLTAEKSDVSLPTAINNSFAPLENFLSFVEELLKEKGIS